MILNDRPLISFTRNIEFHRTIRYSYIYVIKKYISSKSNTKKLHLSISNIIFATGIVSFQLSTLFAQPIIPIPRSI